MLCEIGLLYSRTAGLFVLFILDLCNFIFMLIAFISSLYTWPVIVIILSDIFLTEPYSLQVV